MAERFIIPLKSDPSTALATASAALQRLGGALSGDVHAGSFRGATPVGDVHGTYRLLDNGLEVTITQRPFLLSASRVERELRGFFAG